jgi:hypothetical protein
LKKKKIKKGETTAKGGRHPKKNDTGHVKKEKRKREKEIAL